MSHPHPGKGNPSGPLGHGASSPGIPCCDDYNDKNRVLMTSNSNDGKYK